MKFRSCFQKCSPTPSAPDLSGAGAESWVSLLFMKSCRSAELLLILLPFLMIGSLVLLFLLAAEVGFR
ncbi:MAG: hypothetical protein COZ95_00280, partial [Nitrospirae bacterium CG_4_8_14_3_um_filter_50_41]